MFGIKISRRKLNNNNNKISKISVCATNHEMLLFGVDKCIYHTHWNRLEMAPEKSVFSRGEYTQRNGVYLLWLMFTVGRCKCRTDHMVHHTWSMHARSSMCKSNACCLCIMLVHNSCALCRDQLRAKWSRWVSDAQALHRHLRNPTLHSTTIAE